MSARIARNRTALSAALAAACTGCAIMPPAAPASPENPPSRTAASARPEPSGGTPASTCRGVVPVRLPVTGGQLQDAAALAARFAAAYASHPAGQTPQRWLASLAAMTTPQLQAVLARAALTPGGWPPGQADTVTAVQARDITPAAITFTVALGPAPALAVTVTARPGGGQVVYDAEPAADGSQ